MALAENLQRMTSTREVRSPNALGGRTEPKAVAGRWQSIVAKVAA